MPKFSTQIAGFFRGIAKSFRSGSLSPSAIFSWLHSSESSAAGEIVNESNALKITTVYGSVRVIAESIASLPLKLMERTAGGHQEAVEQNLHYLLSVEANPEMSAYTWIETLVGSAALTGNGFSEIERNKNSGQVVALWPLHPFKTMAKRDPSTHLIYYETSDGMPLNQTRKIAEEDMIHLRLFSLDGLSGISPVEMCRQTLGLAMAMEKSGARHFGNGSNPGGIMTNKNKLDPKAQVEMRESWNQQQGGVNQGKTAFLFGSEWTYQQLGLSNENSQWIESRAFTRADIAMGIFRVPPHMVGSETKMPGSGAEQMALQFVTFCLQPWLTRFEQELVRKLTPTQGRKANKYFIEFSVDAILRCDVKATNEALQLGRIGGYLTGNDCRKKLGMNPADPSTGMDCYWMPVNYQNSARLLDTESLQDQPVDADPVAPTAAEKNMLGHFTRAYITIFADAFKRLSTRKTRDYGAIRALFLPVLTSIADASSNRTGLPTPGGDPESAGVVDDACRSMEKRAARWPEVIAPEDLASMATQEFTRAVRSIYISVSRSTAAAKAVLELAAPEENEDEAA
ncbi:MAG: phage portal protein [Terracidiphilus sp.]|jgi:HK97 family phage portal protein